MHASELSPVRWTPEQACKLESDVTMAMHLPARIAESEAKKTPSGALFAILTTYDAVYVP